MIIGFIWDRMDPRVITQAVQDVLALGPELTGAYWQGVQLDPMMNALRVVRVHDQSEVELWRAYQLDERPFQPKVKGEVILEVLYRSTVRQPLNMPTRKGQLERESLAPEQGRPNTFNPYDRPMPDPNQSTRSPKVNLILTK